MVQVPMLKFSFNSLYVQTRFIHKLLSIRHPSPNTLLSHPFHTFLLGVLSFTKTMSLKNGVQLGYVINEYILRMQK